VLIPAVIFGAVLLMVFAPYWLVVERPEVAARHALRSRLRRAPSVQAATAELGKKVTRLSNIAALDRILANRASLVAPLRRMIDQSGLKVTVGTIVLTSGCLFLLVYLLVSFFTNLRLAGLILAALAGMAPFLWVRRARTNRIRRFETLFPEALDLITRALRAGHAFPTGLRMVAEEMPEPIAGEFRLLYDQQSYGLPLDEAMRNFGNRIPLIDAKFFVTAVLTQREAGGNLSEVLDNLASVMRDRFEVKQQVRTKSAHGRLSGWILAGLPPTLAFTLFIINPQHMKMMIDDPLGVQMIVVAVVLQIIGTLVIRRIVDVDY
jgi:tight adherence protein B